MKLLAIAFLPTMLLLVSCTTTKPYPICYYQSRPSGQAQVVWAESVGKVVEQYTSKTENFAFSPDQSWAYVTATNKQHADLKRVWPAIGCVGRRRTDEEAALYSRCMEHQRKILDTENYELMPSLLFCDGEP